MIVSAALKSSISHFYTTTQLPSTTALSAVNVVDPSEAWNSVGESLSTFATSIVEAAPSSVGQFQKFGENAFAAAFFIAFCQAMVALLQYRNNPSGSLMVPPGQTFGVASPVRSSSSVPATTSRDLDYEEESGDSNWFSALRDLESFVEKEQAEPVMSKLKRTKSQSSSVINRFNRSLVFLIPWASNAFRFLLARNVHLFHLGFIFSLVQLTDFPNRFLAKFDNKSSNFNGEKNQEVQTPNTLPERIVVLGDSLAAGVGTVNVFETKEQDESVSKDEDGPGPVFPRVLAQTISQHTGQPVHWRSAGIVGGDTKDIEESCLNIIREEVAKSQPPDLVVLIVGINDLKRFAVNPLKNAGPQEFRSRLTNLISEIRVLSPGTKVLLPAMPTQMFRQDSPLNIFPLVFFLDSVVGFWDSQKKLVADRFPKNDVLYLGVSPEEIYDWYMTDTTQYGVPADLDENGEEDMTLISADGVHPNARCYAHWAASLGNRLLSELPESFEIESANRLESGETAYCV